MALKKDDYVKITKPRLESIAQSASSAPTGAAASSGKKKEGPVVDDLYKLRHSLAHVLAQAVLKLWPETKITIGPPIEYGCYYDFLFAKPISDDDLPAIEKEMKKIIQQGQTFRCDELNAADAKKFWKDREQNFKVELIEDLEKNDGVTTVTNYANLGPKGEETFVDLCRGGHVENLKEIPADGFKIMTLAGAYWRGDEKREQLTRIYVAAFPSKAELEEYLRILEEAKKRDHRKLGKELDLFTFSELVGPGLPLWTPRGTLLRDLLNDFVWELRRAKGYQRVTIPHITKKELYETSGHWAKFKDDLFRIGTRDGHEFAMKPMNCPHHTQIFASRQRSYRDMPERYAETTMVYRDEQTGELHGLSRVRCITQDDAHVFCRPQQAKDEILKIWEIVDRFYETVGFGKLRVRLSLHNPDEFEKYLGTPDMWKKAESELRGIAVDRKADFFEAPGEAAFYGPKVDFIAKDAIGREWQVATIQLDINMPERFDLFCIDEKGNHERCVMIHAAIMGAIERFLSIYIEHMAGLFPLWVAPVQVGLIPVAGAHEKYALELQETLKKHGIRTQFFGHEDSLGKRIREGETWKIPYLLVMGDKEVEAKSVTVRNVKTKKQVTVSVEEFVKSVVKDVEMRTLEASF
ncbi:MAG: threonine--tRNA ligase [Candidatus Peribacteraceae bacterium]|nr:threonine--tRNA ligase [Candidatus Peribacteraceae bacterium]